MATIDKIVKLTDAQQEAVARTVARENLKIAASNGVIEANKNHAEVNGMTYSGPDVEPLLTFDSLLQQRLDSAIASDETTAAREIARELAEEFMAADPATKEQMLADREKYRRTVTPHPQGARRPTRPR